MELGDELLDGEHAAQMRLLDTFETKMKEGMPRDELLIVLDRLVEFTNLHFMSEEVLMQQHAYPAAGVHAKAHDSLLGQVRAIQNCFMQGDQPMTEAELGTLRSWLVDHIKTMDRGFVEFMERRKKEVE